jgi:putative hydrolase of the HAD superfamily
VKPRIQVVTFDLDNTLWDVNSVIGNAERTLRAWFNEKVPEVNQTFDGDGLAALRTRIVEENPAIVHNLTELRRTMFARSIEQSGYDAHSAQRLADEALTVFLDARHEVTYFDGALEVLEELASRYLLGALSNGNADVFRLGLGDFFSFDYSAAKVGAGKPAPDMFHAALEHAGAEPEQMVHVGDHPEDDIRAAANLGIHTVWVNLTGECYPDDAPATVEVTDLREVPLRIDELAGS